MSDKWKCLAAYREPSKQPNVASVRGFFASVLALGMCNGLGSQMSSRLSVLKSSKRSVTKRECGRRKTGKCWSLTSRDVPHSGVVG